MCGDASSLQISVVHVLEVYETVFFKMSHLSVSNAEISSAEQSYVTQHLKKSSDLWV